MKTQLTIAISAIAGLAIGGFVGYVVTERVLRGQYDILLDEEVERTKEFYKNRSSGITIKQNNKMAEDLSTEEIFEMANERLIRDLNYGSTEEEVRDELPEPSAAEVRPEQESRRMTIEEATAIDYESDEIKAMLVLRNSEEPYIITVDEFMEAMPNYDKLSFTYFEGDDILADEREKPITEINATVGEDHLTMFGRFSKDKNIVYVRNERIETDFEITRDEQSFGEVVAGFKSHNPRMKMRESD